MTSHNLATWKARNRPPIHNDLQSSPHRLTMTMMLKMTRQSLILTLLCAGSSLAASSRSSLVNPWSLSAGAAQSSATALVARIPHGGADMDYVGELEAVKSVVLTTVTAGIEELRRQIVEEGAVVDQFGQKAETLCNQALEDFASKAPEAGDDLSKASAYDRKLQELEAAVDAPLQVLYLKQLGYLRETALQRYRAAAKTSGASDYEAMLQADSQFLREAEDATREGSDWDYTAERSFLQAVMNNIAESGRKAMDVQMTSAQQQQTAMQFLQSQQQMIQQLQQQLYGQTSPWNVGVAYRIPDTNFNLQGSYQQGRANVQLSCVPDEYAPFLGPNGFTNGVGPGNLGLSLNLSI